MKLQPDKSNIPTINAYGEGWIEVNGQRYRHSLTINSVSEQAVHAWPPKDFDAITPQDFEMLATNGAELVIFGSGQRLRFAPAALLQNLMRQGIGVESMDTAAACRTYNILATEGRKVIAALLIEP